MHMTEDGEKNQHSRWTAGRYWRRGSSTTQVIFSETQVWCQESRGALFPKAAKGEEYDEEYKFVSFYDGDLNPTQLRSQLEMLRTHFTAQASTLLFGDVLRFLQDLSAAQKEFFSEVIILAKLILVMPATNASSERAF